MVYISHNLGLILETCDRITVMYSGEAVETGTVGEVFDQMRHPYTRGLFNSIPLPGADKNARPLVPIPASCRCRTSGPGLLVRPRCGWFDQEICGHGQVAMETVDRRPAMARAAGASARSTGRRRGRTARPSRRRWGR